MQKKEKSPKQAKNTALDEGQGPSMHSSAYTQDRENKNFCYVYLFEYLIPDFLGLSQDQQITGKVDKNLRICSTNVRCLYGKCKGGTKRKELNSKTKQDQLFKRQILSVKELIKEKEFINDALVECKKKLC